MNHMNSYVHKNKWEAKERTYYSYLQFIKIIKSFINIKTFKYICVQYWLFVLYVVTCYIIVTYKKYSIKHFIYLEMKKINKLKENIKNNIK